MRHDGGQFHAPSPGQTGKGPALVAGSCGKVGRGTPLRHALWSLGINSFTERELKNLYRLKKFREYYETAKIEFYREWVRTPRRSSNFPY